MNDVKDLILSKFQAPAQAYFQNGTVPDREGAFQYSKEFLNSLTPRGTLPL